jgi:hypothetical protein
MKWGRAPTIEMKSDERRVVGITPDLAETVRSLMVELRSYKADKKRMIKEKEKQT